MKVADFIKKLQEMPQDAEVCMPDYDELNGITYYQESSPEVVKAQYYMLKGNKVYISKWDHIPDWAAIKGEEVIIVPSQFA